MRMPHGSDSTYDNHGCRCTPCTDAHRAVQRRCRVARIAKIRADPTVVRHGKASTYSNWGCRCEECTAARAADRRARRNRAGVSS